MTNMLKFLVLTLVLAIFTPIFVLSQKSDDYTAGVQLIRQSQFEEAYKIFSRLYTQTQIIFRFMIN